MTSDRLRPWSLAPAVTALLVLFIIFIGGTGLLILSAIPSLKATAVTKVLILVLVASTFGGAVCTLMWSRYWRQVQWDAGFWAFVSGPPPEFEEPLLAWRWGRRFRLCWIVTAITLAVIVLSELLAGRWR